MNLTVLVLMGFLPGASSTIAPPPPPILVTIIDTTVFASPIVDTIRLL